MPRVKGDKIENTFIKGLITEKNPIAFPKDAATDALNVIFDEKGTVYRRPGIGQELGGIDTAYTPQDNEVFTEFLWTSAGGIGSKTFFIQQIGSNLFVYDVSDSNSISNTTIALTVDLNDFLPSGSPYLPQEYECQYSKGNGTCIVTNPVCEIFFLDFDFETDAISTVQITLEQRDFEGLEDGEEEYTRPTATVAGITSSNPQYLYNLLNQGWSQSDALSQWDTARIDLPSKRDVVSLYRSSETDAFDNALVTSKAPGTTPAPKGHFIIQTNSSLRSAAAALDGYVIDLNETTLLTAGSDYTVSFNPSYFDTNLAAISDGDTTQSATDCARFNAAYTYSGPGYATKFRITFPSPRKISSVKIYGSNDQGFYSGSSGSPGARVFYLFGGNGTPPSFSGTPSPFFPPSVGLTHLGNTLFTDTSDESAGKVVANTLDPQTTYDFIDIVLNLTTGTTQNVHIAEAEVFSFPTTFQRPQTNAFFQGRAWYAGFEAEQLSSTIFFSQIIENKDQYGRCYQRQDPTNEYFNELLSSDGGTIRILEIEKVVKLFSTQSSVIVLATNGVWEISGNPYFTATNYNIRKMSNIGCFSPLSVVDYKGIPIWWGEDNIYSIQFDPQFQTFQIVNLTEDTIKDLILDIPAENRQYVKGAFDLLDDTVYWLYSTDEELLEADRYKYNNVLALNRRSIAFYPWTFDTTAGNLVRGLVYHNPVKRTALNAMKFLYTTSADDYSYAEFNDYTYHDWEDVSFDSYFVTGYDINQTALKHVHPNYLQFYVDLRDYSGTTTFDLMDDLEEYLLTSDDEVYVLTELQVNPLPGATVRSVYDFITTDTVYRWSNPQQIYPANLDLRRASFRKLKMRGKGKSIQFRVDSEEGKPFFILGWASAMSGNQDV